MRPPGNLGILSSAFTDAGRQPRQTRILQAGQLRLARHVATCCPRPSNPAAHQQVRVRAAAARATAAGRASWPCHPGIHQGCTRCGNVLPAAGFPPHRAHPSGLHSRCQKCSWEHGREHLALNAMAPRSVEARERLKFCPKCSQDLLRTAFYPGKRRWDGLASCCKIYYRGALT